MSTVRFEADGSAVHTEEGDYAPVVAGHGELLRLFPEVAARSQARSIFIINVDNIIGTQPEVVTAFQKMFGFHRELLSFLDELRDACQKRELSDLRDRRIRGLGSMLGLQLPAEGGPALLLGLQVGLFHSGSELQWTAAEELWPALQRLYHRPLTVHGLVPNTGEDAGAIPAFIDLDGQRIKICLEMPHATPEDQTTYFKNPEKATHFNPVFVLHELRPEVPPEHRTDPRFWMLTKKPYEGRQVYYHETVLYEAIGNSLTNNIVFVEIPRFLFNPHKEFTDCRGRTAASYGFEQQPES